MYIAVKGGERAIAASYRLLDARRRGDRAVAALSVAQIREQLALLVDRVMSDSGVADAELAALAIKQAAGDVIEAGFLLRAYRTTLPRLGDVTLDTRAMRVMRRISAIFKDLPGGQVLGPTFDYTQRLLDFSLLDEGPASTGDDVAAAGDCAAVVGATTDMPVPAAAGRAADPASAGCPSALDLLASDRLVETPAVSDGDPDPCDVTRDPPLFPLDRPARLQMLARADEGWLLGMGYSTQRGYAHTHPFAGDLRVGAVPLTLIPDELGFPITIGELTVTECEMVSQFVGSAAAAPQFTRGYGLTVGQSERKAMAMSLVDRALRADEFGELRSAPVQDQEFVLSHGDNVEASGFVQHLKLPHYVTFAAEMQLLQALRGAAATGAEE
ncbi:MAG: carbon-phosphorus lyase complex subunit PhnI [Lautropia sp.]